MAAVMLGYSGEGASRSRRSPASRTALAVAGPNVPMEILFCLKSGKFFSKAWIPLGLKKISKS